MLWQLQIVVVGALLYESEAFDPAVTASLDEIFAFIKGTS
jgi:hypothetical protein